MIPAASTPSTSPFAALYGRYDAAMGRALELASQAGQAGEIPVGAVILNAEGEIVGEGANAREGACDPSAHAEIVALRAAAGRLGDSHLDGCTLVVTLEPCTMCAGAVQLARIERVVFGAWEPKTGACGSLRDVLRDARATHQVQVVAGLREAESAALLQDFFSRRRQETSKTTVCECIEDEFDLAVGKAALQEYENSGRISHPIEQLWEECGL